MPRFVCFALIVVLLSACSTQPSRYKLKDDVEPQGTFDASGIPLVEAKWEPLSRQGNASPYTVRGKQYEVLASDEAYSETGYASWYGLKFHDELTSNGERYNMYTFTAAHKSLPLPSYVRVTNLENGKALVVRVNDRGPFHSDRIIDMSYAAAIRLGFKDKGTAKVRVERILVPNPSLVKPVIAGEEQKTAPKVPVEKKDRLAPFVQVAAFSTHDLAEATKERIVRVLPNVNVFVASAPNTSKPLYRVRIGPFNNQEEAQKVLDQLRQEAIGAPQVITRSVNAADR